jgi:hypothetical protein
MRWATAVGLSRASHGLVTHDQRPIGIGGWHRKANRYKTRFGLSLTLTAPEPPPIRVTLNLSVVGKTQLLRTLANRGDRSVER